ncbi:hypothetical protein CFT12S00416_08940 [Campylobacter fetus subsp. testudinum]|uniref:hypothetical protein n=1 Tax=Campylobacter fetus TaxID=196 RepID=UPI000818C8F6|nr:hypothetical protein [Campylobacter fetus]OCR86951.1 hypothetical protein CFT12S00416_08940 [Campylobacter fetus subsp. testudinum]OCR98942.1 hypothetical protein A9K75_09215 [Campylobacter fetus subsp. testudinum]
MSLELEKELLESIAKFGKEIEKLRLDINVLAKYTKDQLALVKREIVKLSSDLDKMEDNVVDIASKTIANNSKANATLSENSPYINNLILDDLDEREKRLFEAVEQLINDKLQYKRKKFFGIF